MCHTPKDASAKQRLPLPRDLDESVNMTGQGPHDDPDKLDPSVQQAARDLQAGLKDTSRAPEVDRTYKDVTGKPNG